MPPAIQWKRDLTYPTWEGLIVLDSSRSDERIQQWTAEPHPDIAQYIRSYWLVDWTIPKDSQMVCLVAPTPCCHLFSMNLHGVPGFPLKLSLLGPRNKGEIRSLFGRGQTFGVEFHPGGLYALLKEPIDNLLNSSIEDAGTSLNLSVPLPHEWDFKMLAEWLQNFEKATLAKLSDETNLSKISVAIDCILQTDEIVAAKDISGEVHVSERSLQRYFEREVGLSFNDVARIARFNRAIKKIQNRSSENIAEIALDCGFFDQAHFAKEFRRLSNLKPSQFSSYL